MVKPWPAGSVALLGIEESVPFYRAILAYAPHIYRKLQILMNPYLAILYGQYVHRQLLLPDKFGRHCISENVTVVGSLLRIAY